MQEPPQALNRDVNFHPFVLPAQATMVGAPPAGPPPSPAGSNETSHRPNRGCEGERQYHTLISLLGLLATMRRVVNYHSSWARQQQVELFDASGFPGYSDDRGADPSRGAPGGG
ncbi:rad21-like protein [Dorcoceras hygrometricum]|uniref:Rad21-like protein n=1 Tax=Dorcoceras hygrometricum TaxID=472368 RepID=A0A2Z7A9X7_9LAMI|nr:rad21-like protein [Dorcoceras hygrometricum]